MLAYVWVSFEDSPIVNFIGFHAENLYSNFSISKYKIIQRTSVVG